MIMITVTEKKNENFFVELMAEEDPRIRNYRYGIEKVFHGKYLEHFYLPMVHQAALLIGCGKNKELDRNEIKEIFAVASLKLKEYKIHTCSLDIGGFIKQYGTDCLSDIILGFYLGRYEYCLSEKKKETEEFQLQLNGVKNEEEANRIIRETQELAASVIFARDMVNTPGNRLRPMDFARAIIDYLEGTNIEVETIVYGQLKAMGMQAIAGIGGSSEFPPCLLVLRYRGKRDEQTITGLIGKGVTCDTGGYCLKQASGMAGIKGDMAGAAAVAGAMHALAMVNAKVNVTACLPLCENRISPSALLPGDVITAYGGKTIEILNTDAEGRLILADAMSYGMSKEGITRVIDIATLTGAVYSALGFTIAGALSDDTGFYQEFEAAALKSGERYLRFPYGREHEKMIDSTIADVKNTGADCCGTITAGLFIRRFAQGKPWIHLDIAGTAWTSDPIYAFDKKGATGAGVTSLYYMLRGEN